MNDYCGAPRCMERRSRDSTVDFFDFPVDRTLKKLWMKAISEPGYNPPIGSKICSLHFREDSFKKKRGKKELREGAIPFKFDPAKKRKVILPAELPKKIAATQVKKLRPILPKRQLDVSMFDTDTDSDVEGHNLSKVKKEREEVSTVLPEGLKTVISQGESLQLVIIPNTVQKTNEVNTVSVKNEVVELDENIVHEEVTDITQLIQTTFETSEAQLTEVLSEPVGPKGSTKMKASRTGTYLLVNKDLLKDGPDVHTSSGAKKKVFFLKKSLLNEAVNEALNDDSNEATDIVQADDEDTAAEIQQTESASKKSPKKVADILKMFEDENDVTQPNQHNYQYSSMASKNKQLIEFNTKLRRKIKMIQQRCRRRDERVKKLKQLLALLVQKYGKGVYDLKQLLGLTSDVQVVEELSESEQEEK